MNVAITGTNLAKKKKETGKTWQKKWMENDNGFGLPLNGSSLPLKG